MYQWDSQVFLSILLLFSSAILTFLQISQFFSNFSNYRFFYLTPGPYMISSWLIFQPSDLFLNKITPLAFVSLFMLLLLPKTYIPPICACAVLRCLLHTPSLQGELPDCHGRKWSILWAFCFHGTSTFYFDTYCLGSGGIFLIVLRTFNMRSTLIVNFMLRYRINYKHKVVQWISRTYLTWLATLAVESQLPVSASF